MLPFDKNQISVLTKIMRDHNIFPVFLPRYIDVEEEHPIYSTLNNILIEGQSFLSNADNEILVAAYSTLNEVFRVRVTEKELLHRSPAALQKVLMDSLIYELYETYTDYTIYLDDKDFNNSVIRKLYPKLENYFDSDKLLSLSTPKAEFTRDGVFYNNHMLHYHQFLRRGFSSNPNFDFLELLIKYQKAYPEQNVRVAVDHTRLMERKWFEGPYFEKDFWYGPPLSWKDIDNPYKVGLTTHGKQPDPLDIPTGNEIERTEFYWTYNKQDKVKTLQIEEVQTLEPKYNKNSELVINRYIHSRRDTTRQGFIHLDGAVKVYLRNDYSKRYSTKMSDTNFDKSNFYIKLFRIDSLVTEDEKTILDEKIEDNKWSELVSLFFRGNELVREYLGKEEL